MTDSTLTIRHLSFTGPRKKPASLKFGPGLNVVYGASETGKSFMLESIDFMLGSSTALRDIPERVGYDRIFLGVEDSDGSLFTLERAAAGGQFRCFEGLHLELPENAESIKLRQQHNPTNNDNLSMYLLKRIGLAGKRIRKNTRGATDLRPFFHPLISRVSCVFEPVGLGGATGRGAQAPMYRSAPSRCMPGALRVA